MFLFLPIIVGCPTKYKALDGQQLARVCPHCHNASLICAKRTTWFEFFFIPVVPISSKRVWMCHICRWSAPLVDGQDFPAAYGGHQDYPISGQGWQPAPSYQPYDSYPKRN
ncbi:hypothetical protein APHAL10511_001296 [Amanita phalloides]|nr:hypothetical protein APHAL10511_001296 [Amanita phalloides]